MDYNRIAFLLKKEIEHQGKLHDVLQREKQAIMTFESEQIEKIAEEKKVFLEQSSATQKKLAKELTPEGEANPEKLEKAIARCSVAPLRKELIMLGGALKAKAESVRKLNARNADLTRQSLGLIGSTMSILCSVPETELPTYGLNAKLVNDAPDPAFGPRNRSIAREA